VIIHYMFLSPCCSASPQAQKSQPSDHRVKPLEL
jgi:hypothetical protein